MIVKSNALRAVASLLLYFLIFEAPLRIMNLITRSMVPSIENAPVYSFVLILSAIAAVVYYLMGFPVLSLICTRIYNTKILHGGDQHPDTR